VNIPTVVKKCVVSRRRRLIRNQLGSARKGSNPFAVAILFCFLLLNETHKAQMTLFTSGGFLAEISSPHLDAHAVRRSSARCMQVFHAALGSKEHEWGRRSTLWYASVEIPMTIFLKSEGNWSVWTSARC